MSFIKAPPEIQHLAQCCPKATIHLLNIHQNERLSSAWGNNIAIAHDVSKETVVQPLISYVLGHKIDIDDWKLHLTAPPNFIHASSLPSLEKNRSVSSTEGTVANVRVSSQSRTGYVIRRFTTCNSTGCKCHNGERHGPYYYLRKYDPSKACKKRDIYLGKEGTDGLVQRCFDYNIKLKEIENLVSES